MITQKNPTQQIKRSQPEGAADKRKGAHASSPTKRRTADKSGPSYNVEQIFSIDASRLIIRGWLRCGSASQRGQFKIRSDRHDFSADPVKVIYYSRGDVRAALEAVDIKVQENEAKQLGFLICVVLPEAIADESPDLHLDWISETSKSHELIRWNLLKHSPLSQLKNLWSTECTPFTGAFAAIERLPCHLVQDQAETYSPADHGFEFSADWGFPAGDQGVFYIGWMVDPNRSVVGLFAPCSDGIATNLTKLPVLNYPRGDLAGLCAKFGLDFQSAGLAFFNPGEGDPSTAEDAGIFALLDNGQVVKIPPALNWVNDGKPLDRIRKMLDMLYYEPADVRHVFDHFLAPAIKGIFAEEIASHSRQSPVLKISPFGQQPRSPQTSIIVPLYGRYDFVMYQLAQFANDADFTSGRLELIYVCDDPRLEKALATAAADWFSVYQVPFQLVSYQQNLGYAGANNIGARVARGQQLILLNSDVLPRETGWASQIARRLEAAPAHSVVGATLLFHDQSVQHAGIAYLRDEAIWGGLWRCHHPRKGLPYRPTGATEPQPVPAVTGACLAVARPTYRQLDGLSEEYILGDFEDSDFCMKARAAGGEILLLPDVVLYHVERQSQSLVAAGHWKEKITIFNAWQHDQRWRSTIESLNFREE